MAHVYFDRVAETASNKPTDAQTFSLPNTALDASHRAFDTVMDSTDTCDYVAYSTAGFESGIGTFTAGSPDTLARTTIKQSSTGSAVDFSGGGDVVVMLAPASSEGLRNDQSGWRDYSAQTLTTGNATVTVNTLHLLTISGLTAARDFVLPAVAAVGDRVGVYCVTDAAATAANVLQIKNSSGDTIDGTDHASTIKTALLIKGELMIFRCVTADSAWITEKDGRIPCFAEMSRQSGTDAVNGGGFVKVQIEAIDNNIGGLADATNKRINIRRASRYIVVPYLFLAAMSDTTAALVAIYVDGAIVRRGQQQTHGSGTSTNDGLGGSIPLSLAAGAYVEMYGLSTDADSVTVNAAASTYSRLTVIEVL